jgi:hypothetical protein
MGNLPHTDALTALEESRRWVPILRRIIGPYVLREASFEEDAHEATDLIVLRAGGLRIACRVRSNGYVERYPTDITITARRESGARCEWNKLIEGGLGDWFFYGHDAGTEIFPWWLIDLPVARPWLLENHGRLIGPNLDLPGKRCWFYAFDAKSLWLALGWKAFVAFSTKKGRAERPPGAQS